MKEYKTLGRLIYNVFKYYPDKKAALHMLKSQIPKTYIINFFNNDKEDLENFSDIISEISFNKIENDPFDRDKLLAIFEGFLAESK